MEKTSTTPKDFFLWAGAVVALYGSIIAFLSLMFAYLDYAYPDALSYFSSDPYSGGISYAMASLLVLSPVFLSLMYFIRRTIAAEGGKRDIWVRRWAIFFTLFLAGAVMVGDLITLLMYFFNGDVTVRFVLKVVLLLLVGAGVFMHFLADQWGYWDQYPRRALSVTAGVALIVLLTILSGFLVVGTPWQARAYRYDDQRVSDLQQIQSQIINYWQSKNALPSNLNALRDSVSGTVPPNDPQTALPYEYTITNSNTFTLCAIFNAPTQPYALDQYDRVAYTSGPIGSTTPESWYHGAGHSCYTRTIDKDLYPPYSKSIPTGN